MNVVYLFKKIAIINITILLLQFFLKISFYDETINIY